MQSEKEELMTKCDFIKARKEEILSIWQKICKDAFKKCQFFWMNPEKGGEHVSFIEQFRKIQM